MYYQNYNDINETYNNFIPKFMGFIDKAAPIRERRVKQNPPKERYMETAEKMKNRNKLLKKLKKSKLHIEKYIHNELGHKFEQIIFNKSFFKI